MQKEGNVAAKLGGHVSQLLAAPTQLPSKIGGYKRCCRVAGSSSQASSSRYSFDQANLCACLDSCVVPQTFDGLYHNVVRLFR